jgi:hypothetical protein
MRELIITALIFSFDGKIFVIGGEPHPGLTVSDENEICK